MKAVIRSLGSKVIAATVSIVAMSLAVGDASAAPVSSQPVAHFEFHHRHEETNIAAPNLDALRFRVTDAINHGWVPVGPAWFDGFAWVQHLVRD